jgi:hypothetical protein
MNRARYLLTLVIVLVLNSSAKAQQARAPAGGAWYGGHFYQGGQFMPNGAGTGIGNPAMGMGLIGPSFDFPEPRTAYRKKARTKYRTTAKDVATGSVANTGLADSRLKMAKSLLMQGKDEQARGWLLKISDTNASDATASEACRLLCEIEGRLGPAVPEKTLVTGK